MSKPTRNRDSLVSAGEKQLAQWDLPSSTTPTELETFVGRSVEADAAIAARLGGIAEPESARILKAMEAVAADKRLRREIRRALYRLEQRGVQTPTEAPKEPPIPSIITPAIEGYLTGFDGQGNQLVWLVRPRADRLAHFYAVINDPDGLCECDLNVITRKELKRFREELLQRHRIRLVEADWQYCDFLMHRAFEWTRRRGGSIEGDYIGARAWIVHKPPATDRPPLILNHIRVEDSETDALLSRSASLLEEPEFQTWLLPHEIVETYVEEFRAIGNSPLVLAPEQQNERVDALRRKAVSELYGGDRAASYARRMYAQAFVLWASGRPERAREAVAVAQTLERSGAATGIALFEHLVTASIGLWLRAVIERDRAEREASLIIPARDLAGWHRRPPG